MFFCAGAIYCQKFRQGLLISGSITASSAYVARGRATPLSLFIIVKDVGGVPIAVKRVVNPQFPLSFVVGADDLLIPSLHPKSPLTIEAELNSKGRIGPPVSGDFFGVCPYSVGPRQQDVGIVIDRR